jgi:TatD-related deoxyribonuclease
MSIWDNHIHLREDGLGVEAARRFARSGGTHMLLTHAPVRDLPLRAPADFDRAFQRTLRLAERVREEVGVVVHVALGPYPVELLHLKQEHGLEAAERLMMKGMEIAGRHVAEGRAIALGEIGRPHFPCEPAIREASNRILRYGMRVAKEVGCAVVLHTEDPTPRVFEELATLADEVGLRREKVVKHHCPPLTRVADNYGVFPSILAREADILEALKGGTRFLLETDYIDDPKRPGAVLGPASVPKKTALLLRKGLITPDEAAAIHVDNPERVYGVEVV